MPYAVPPGDLFESEALWDPGAKLRGSTSAPAAAAVKTVGAVAADFDNFVQLGADPTVSKVFPHTNVSRVVFNIHPCLRAFTHVCMSVYVTLAVFFAVLFYGSDVCVSHSSPLPHSHFPRLHQCWWIVGFGFDLMPGGEESDELAQIALPVLVLFFRARVPELYSKSNTTNAVVFGRGDCVGQDAPSNHKSCFKIPHNTTIPQSYSLVCTVLCHMHVCICQEDGLKKKDTKKFMYIGIHSGSTYRRVGGSHLVFACWYLKD